jgi:hypothetical protein
MKKDYNNIPFKNSSINRLTNNTTKPSPRDIQNRFNKKSNKDSLAEDIYEIADPTGISSWDDVARSYKKTGLSGETMWEAFGAVPLIGKIGKAGNAIDMISTGLKMTARQSRQAKMASKAIKTTAKFGPKSQKISDAYQAYQAQNTPKIKKTQTYMPDVVVKVKKK